MSNPKEILNLVASCLENKEGGSTSVNGNFFSDIESSLREQGFKYYSSGSCCSKASDEANLEKDGLKVNLVTSNFLGVFTQVNCSYR